MDDSDRVVGQAHVHSRNPGLLHSKCPAGPDTLILIAATLAFRRLICRVLIGVLLSTQFAIASYACPASGTPDAEHQASSSTASMASLELVDTTGPHSGMDAADTSSGQTHPGMAPTLPNLCLSHCQFGQQTAEHTPAPVVAPALLTALYTLPSLDRAAASPRLISRADRPAVVADPPHAILHCCLRD